MARLSRLRPSQLDQVQREVYQRITTGPRATGPHVLPLTDADGGLTGPFGILLHAPELGSVLQELGARVRYRTRLPDRVREIAILQVAADRSSEFEWRTHESVGRAVGLTDAELAALRAGRTPRLAGPEAAAHGFVAHLLADPDRMPDPVYDAAAVALGERQLVELTILVGYYRLLADAMHVFEVGEDRP